MNTRRCSQCNTIFPASDKTCPSCNSERQASKDGTSLRGKTEVIWLAVIGMNHILGDAQASLVNDIPRAVVWTPGAIASVFALPIVLLLIARNE